MNKDKLLEYAQRRFRIMVEAYERIKEENDRLKKELEKSKGSCICNPLYTRSMDMSIRFDKTYCDVADCNNGKSEEIELPSAQEIKVCMDCAITINRLIDDGNVYCLSDLRVVVRPYP